MDEKPQDPQIQHFSNELDNLIERFRAEYDLSYASAIGTLMMKAHLLMVEAEGRSDEV